MTDVRLYQGEAQPKDVRLRSAVPTPPPPTVGYQYNNGLVTIQVAG